jgi:hypothetical protein
MSNSVNMPILSRARSRMWKIIRPVVLGVDWLFMAVFSSNKGRPDDADIEAGSFETQHRVGPPPPYGGGSGPPL